MSDQHFLVSARKYRPQLFGELVAQEHVTDTLKNAVRLDRLAHAYLFSGPRGVGKTTAARILAKAINCTTPPEDRADAAEPCRSCDSCRSFEEGRNMNILEIDAASNNKVDDVRELRETVRIPPQGNRKKVYIVDEVHMLTTQAFNALLKTLEEPPAHALFIFATTEPHKVLPTIQSRCQRFDFRRIPVPEIIEHLHAICKAESIAADDGSLMLVARRADGALRDALSVFDQAVSLCGKNLTIAALSEALGVVGEDLFFELTDHAASGSGAGMLELVQRVVASGFDLQEFLDGVAEHLRNLLVAVTMPDTDLIEASQATRERYAAVAKNFEEARLLRLLSVVDDAMERVKNSRQPRLRLELALLKIAAMPATLDIRRVLGMLDGSEPLPAVQLERAAGTPAPAPVQAAAPAEAAKSVPVAVTPSPAAAVPAAAAAQTSPPPAKPPNPIPAAPEPEEQDELALWERAHESETAAPPPPPEPTLPFDNLHPASAPATGRESRDAFGQPALFVTPKPRKDDSHASAGDSDVAVAELVEADAPEFWQTFVSRVMDEKIHVGALLRHARAATRPDGVLEIRVPDSLSNRMLREHEALLLQVARELGGDHWTAVTLSVDAAGAQPDPNAPREHDPEASLRALCEEYPALRVLMERFGGEIVW